MIPSAFHLDGFYTAAQTKSWRRVPAKMFLGEVDRRSESGEEEVLGLSGSKGVLKRSEMGQRASEAVSYVGYKQVAPGQLICNKMQAWNGMFGISPYEGITSPDYAVYQFKDQTEPRFVEYTVRTRLYAAEFLCRSKGMGTGFLRLNPGEFLSTPFWLPNLETQKSIADFLDRETARIDQLIEKKGRLIEVLKVAHASQTLRVMRRGFDRLDYDSDTDRVNFSGLKSNWKRLRIKQVVSHMTSGSRAWGEQIQDEGELFLQSGCITTRMGVSIEGAPRVAPQRGAEANRTRVKAKDVLVCITGGRTGAVGFVSELGETAYVNQHVCLIRSNPKKVIPKLLAQVLFSEIGQLQFRMAQYGLKQGLGFAEVANVVIPCPPLELQPSICSAIDAASRRLESSTARVLLSIERLREFRSALITAAVTGQIDVNTWSRRGSTDRRLDQIEEDMRA